MNALYMGDQLSRKYAGYLNRLEAAIGALRSIPGAEQEIEGLRQLRDAYAWKREKLAYYSDAFDALRHVGTPAPRAKRGYSWTGGKHPRDVCSRPVVRHVANVAYALGQWVPFSFDELYGHFSHRSNRSIRRALRELADAKFVAVHGKNAYRTLLKAA